MPGSVGGPVSAAVNGLVSGTAGYVAGYAAASARQHRQAAPAQTGNHEDGPSGDAATE